MVVLPGDRGGRMADLEDDDTWFESPIQRSGGKLNLWLGLGVVAVGALGFGLGAFANPPVNTDAAGEAMRARARAAEGTRPLAGTLLLERMDRALSMDALKVAAAPAEPVKVETPPPAPEVVPPTPEEPKPEVPKPEEKPKAVRTTDVARVEKPAEVKPAEVKPVEPATPEPVPTSTIEQALVDGKKHLDARRWAEAKAAFEKALAAAPGNTRALFGRGRALFELRQTTAAMKDFEAVLAAEPSHPNALLMAGSAAQELGRKDDARRFYERYLAAWPTGRRASEIKLLLERL